MIPIPRLAGFWPWIGHLAKPMVRALGVIDLLGGFGVLLPMLTGILPRVTVAAAFGCVVLQVCALVFHMFRHEFAATPVSADLPAMAAFMLWGRWSF